MTVKTRRESNGFTLIEVLIALLIIAIALAAAVRSVNQSVRTTMHVRNTVAAHWVGMNILSEIQTGMIRAPTASNPITGKTSMMNQTWEWTASVTPSIAMQPINKITVTVRLRNHVINTVVGYGM